MNPLDWFMISPVLVVSLCLEFFATFLKKGSAKNFPTGKILGYFSKIVRSDGYWFYAVGVCGLNFNTTMPEFGCRHCRPFLKKGSAKNFPTGKILGYFSKIVRSTVISSTPKALFRQQIFNASVGERLDSMEGSLREGAVERM